MTAPKTAEEWGRLAVSLPGWRWLPGMFIPEHGRIIVSWYEDKQGDKWPDPDDPATAGCLLALLGGEAFSLWASDHFDSRNIGIGRACIAYAAALGRWPGGAE